MSHSQSTIAFLLFDDLEELDFVGPYEMLSAWSQYFNGPSNVITISENAKVKGAKGLTFVTDYGFENCPQRIDYLLVPGGKGTRSQIYNTKFMQFLQSMPTKFQCKYILSVCTGVFLLEKAGLLKPGMNVSTHWGSLDRLRECEYLNVVEQRVTQNEKVWTSSGVASGIHLALQFIAFIDGDDVAGKVQFYTEYYPTCKRYGNIAETHPKVPSYLKAKL